MRMNVNTALMLVEALSKEALIKNADGALGYSILRNVERLNREEKVISALKLQQSLLSKHNVNAETDQHSDNFKKYLSEIQPIFLEEFEIELIRVNRNELDNLFSLGLKGVTALDISLIETFVSQSQN